MDQKKLYKTIETISSGNFDSDKDMLIEVLNQIVLNQQIEISGGRMWRLNTDEKSYELLYQTGKIERIAENFSLKINDYPIFDYIAKERTVLGSETNATLREKGIFRYSASGVGYKVKLDDKPYYEYLLALNSDEINEDLRLALNIISTALTSRIKQRSVSSRANIMKAGLDKARELQKSILPEHQYNFHDYELFGVTNPAEIVGGDFFDYIEMGEDDKLAVIVGDAASKGVSAAAEAMYISGALRMGANFEIKISPLMKRMNKLVNKIFADDKFASMFYGELSTEKSGLFLYSNAGHNPPIFLKGDSNQVELLNTTGPVLGPTPNAKFLVDNIKIHPGDVLFIYSDGVTDSTDSEFNNYGEERLLDLLKKVKDKSAREINYAVLEDVIKFSKRGSYNDDKTIVVIKRN
ncbi:MAG: PP2C family protein-serine/threonine phosphatase [Ignavibacteriaceae bacterium]